MKKIIIWITAFILLFSPVYAYEIFFYQNDNLGSPAVVTNKAGEVVWKTDYRPFGETLNEEGDNKLKYNSKEEDNTGLLYYGARYYNPRIGRFITADTVKGRLVDTQSQNRYAYVKNNPYKYVDPKGRQGISIEFAEFLSRITANLAVAWANERYNNEKSLNAKNAGYEEFEYYGREIATYDKGQVRAYDAAGLKRISCVEIVTGGLCSATGDRSWNYKTMAEVGRRLKKEGWETIFLVASPTKANRYGAGGKSEGISAYTAKLVKGEYKGAKYHVDIDYYVTGKDFDELRGKLANVNGFVEWQEGIHTGVLFGGDFLEAHWLNYPGDVFEKTDLIDYQREGSWETGVLYVPPGTFEGEKWRLK